MIREATISICLGGTIVASTLNLRLTSLDVVAETAKGVQLSNGRKLIWLPRKALLKSRREADYRLARWFEPTCFQREVLESRVELVPLESFPAWDLQPESAGN